MSPRPLIFEKRIGSEVFDTSNFNTAYFQLVCDLDPANLSENTALPVACRVGISNAILKLVSCPKLSHSYCLMFNCFV